MTEVDAYVRAKLLYELVVGILSGSHNKGDGEDAMDAHARQLGDLLLSTAHAECLVQPVALASRDQNASLLGLTPALLREAAGVADEGLRRRCQDAARLVLLPQVEAALQRKCIEICDLVSESITAPPLPPSSLPHVTPATFAAPSNMARVVDTPTHVVALKTRLTQLSGENARAQHRIHALRLHELSLYKRLLTQTSELLVQYKQRDQPKALQAKAEYLLAFSKALRLKVMTTTQQLRVDTCTGNDNRTRVLRQLHNALQERKQRALDEQDQLRGRLQLYEAGDSQYQAMVSEYQRVLQGIQEKRHWIQSLAI
ncbi:TPA: hypothetical protein N0F65_000577 [Lagenidium giganteum]|uniref:HAUS augmin-like complex subunit 4 n=1 Tax=Lagenidium giganteum TaxID=4803 RepID=A0AAV2YB65_9STRA|nr:TPA: hypothetical protein N0F65_000577 [Lagenidium giganteum]